MPEMNLVADPRRNNIAICTNQLPEISFIFFSTKQRNDSITISLSEINLD
jgi:hypothetical protein